MAQKWTEAQRAKFRATMARRKAERGAGGAPPRKGRSKALSAAGAASSPATGPGGPQTPSRRSRSLERRLVEVLEEITVVSLAELRRDRRLRARLVDAVETLLHAIS